VPRRRAHLQFDRKLQELRGRTRVSIDHPDLPDALKDVAAGAIQTIWQAANEAASAELAALRAEARDAANAAEAERDAAHAETAAAREDALVLFVQLGEARQAQDAYLEAASMGSYSVAVFKDAQLLHFDAGAVFSRNGTIFRDDGKLGESFETCKM
jgi:hypothetical protein